MNKKKEYYSYIFNYNEEKKILIWYTSDSGVNGFLLNLDNQFIVVENKDEFFKKLENKYGESHFDEETIVDLDKFFSSLRHLRVGRSSSRKTCEALLEGWNLIEDMAKSLGYVNELDILSQPLFNKIYDKLFYGNNLPSVTPEGKSYNPIWSKEEMTFFRVEFRSIWKKIAVSGFPCKDMVR